LPFLSLGSVIFEEVDCRRQLRRSLFFSAGGMGIKPKTNANTQRKWRQDSLDFFYAEAMLFAKNKLVGDGAEHSVPKEMAPNIHSLMPRFFGQTDQFINR